MRLFWKHVKMRMESHNEMDQDACHFVKACLLSPYPRIRCLLPERYWTFGRNDMHWKPYMTVNPPTNLLMHHANWTVGVANKLRLLEAVRNDHAVIRQSGFGMPFRTPTPWVDLQRDAIVRMACPPDDPVERTLPYSEVTRMLEDQRRQLTGPRHHPLPLALVLQFFSGDKHRAIELARLMADLEPAKRDDVVFIFARQDNCPMDDEIQAAQLYVGRKFSVMDMVTKVDPEKKYPGVCFDAFASACQQLSDWYHTGLLPYGNAFFFEADGAPLRSTWIDDIKRAHTETLMAGKRVTGPAMRFGGIDSMHQPAGHVNGSNGSPSFAVGRSPELAPLPT